MRQFIINNNTARAHYSKMFRETSHTQDHPMEQMSFENFIDLSPRRNYYEVGDDPFFAIDHNLFNDDSIFSGLNNLFEERLQHSVPQFQNQNISQAEVIEVQDRSPSQPKQQPHEQPTNPPTQQTANSTGDAEKLTTEEPYPTKNYMQFAKKPHLQYIKKMKGIHFIQKHQYLRNLSRKFGISMKDYVYLYKMKELQEVWKSFFKKRILQRSIMLTRLEKEQRIRFVVLLFRFQEAFQSKEFNYIIPEDMKKWKLFRKSKRNGRKQSYSTDESGSDHSEN